MLRRSRHRLSEGLVIVRKLLSAQISLIDNAQYRADKTAEETCYQGASYQIFARQTILALLFGMNPKSELQL